MLLSALKRKTKCKAHWTTKRVILLPNISVRHYQPSTFCYVVALDQKRRKQGYNINIFLGVNCQMNFWLSFGIVHFEITNYAVNLH